MTPTITHLLRPKASVTVGPTKENAPQAKIVRGFTTKQIKAKRRAKVKEKVSGVVPAVADAEALQIQTCNLTALRRRFPTKPPTNNKNATFSKKVTAVTEQVVLTDILRRAGIIHHTKGTCQKGDKCQFAHMRNRTAAPATEITTALQKPDRGRSPARKEKKDKDKRKSDETAAIAIEIQNDTKLDYGGHDHETVLFCGSETSTEKDERKVHFGDGTNPFWEIRKFKAKFMREYDYDSDIPNSKKTHRPATVPVPAYLSKAASESAQQTANWLSKELGTFAVPKATALKTQPAAVTQNAGGPKVIIDSGSGSHLAKRVPNMPGIKKGTPITLATANGLLSVDECVDVSFGLHDNKGKPLNLEALLLDNTPNVLSLGRLVEDEGYQFLWTRNKPPQLVALSGKVFSLEVQRYVPCIPENCLQALTQESVFRVASRETTRG